MFQPIYKASRLIIGNPKSNVAICCLWTKASDIAAKIDPKNYCVIGNLFSAERGLDILVRNLLANPNITNLIITGSDLSKSGIVLKDFFEKGFERGKTEITGKPVWRVKSNFPGYINLDIPQSALEELRKSINVQRIDNLSEFDIKNLPKPKGKRRKAVYIIPKDDVKVFCGEDAVWVVRGKKVVDVWLQILDTILKFGKLSSTHYDDRQKEILNLISVIADEDPNNFYIPNFLPYGKEHIEQYVKKVITDWKEPGTSYTYGSRMRSWFGIDQVNEAVKKLAREPISRAVVINLWDSKKDLTIGGSPCINHIWLRIRDGKLYQTVTIRSNDMFEAWPENAFGLRALQEIIRRDLEKAGLNVALGDLIINSQSAHIYEDCWEKAEQIVKSYYDMYVPAPSQQYDERGNFVINVVDGKIQVEHISPKGEHIGLYQGQTAKELRDILARQGIIGNIAHALYLGIELARAETALKQKIEYVQDSV
jgi:thymidylate synthase